MNTAMNRDIADLILYADPPLTGQQRPGGGGAGGGDSHICPVQVCAVIKTHFLFWPVLKTPPPFSSLTRAQALVLFTGDLLVGGPLVL